jgi:hypothetical protein
MFIFILAVSLELLAFSNTAIKLLNDEPKLIAQG